MKKLRLNMMSLVLFALVLFPGFEKLSAQNLTTSPYSRYGIGDLVSRSTGRSQAMGGLSCGLRSNHNLNLLNPASLVGIDSQDFIFEMGAFERVTSFETTNQQRTVNNLGFSYVALGFPITKWLKASVGIVPMSNVGYSMNVVEESPIMGTVNYDYEGSGGISQFFISGSVSPNQYLSLGATFSYDFGPVDHSRSLSISADSGYFSTQVIQSAIVGDINFSYGAQVNIPLNDNKFITLGGTFQNQSTLNATSRTTIIATGTSLTDTLSYIEDPNNSVILPMGWATGFTFGKKDKFTAGFDYRTQNWSKAEFLGQKDSMANSHDYIFGVEYVPNVNSITQYLKRVRYRAGFRYSDSYLQVYGSQLKDISLTLGAGFPILDRNRTRTQSSLNLILEVGRRGTTDNSLVRETFGSLTLQLSLHDYWFVQSKFD